MRSSPKLLLVAVLSSLIAACGLQDSTSALGVPLTTQVRLSGTPTATYDAQTGKTSVTLQFTARSIGANEPTSTSLDRDEMSVVLLVNGRPLDNESLTKEDSQALATSVVYGMVLDASYSMLQSNPPAFEPMKQAAKASVDRGAQLWERSAGTFTSVVSWFDEYIYTQDSTWQSSDILSIPRPAPGTATRLFAAVDAMATRLHSMYRDAPAAAPRDRHLMLVFSDGADNLSWFDNASVSQRLTTTTGATYRKAGAPSVSLAQAIEKVKAHPQLTVHVIGLGSQVNEAELRSIADAGGGQYFSNPSPADIQSVFERVTREFGSLQTIGATIPIPPGDHVLELRVTPKDGSLPATCRLKLKAGQDAQLAAECLASPT